MAVRHSAGDADKMLAKLKASRTGKKGSITKRMNQINQMVDEGGSRRVIAALLGCLKRVFGELNEVCTQISNSSDEVDENNCIELIRANVDHCIAIAEDNLEARKNDPPSTGSITGTWLENCSRIYDDDVRSEKFGSEGSGSGSKEGILDKESTTLQQGMDHTDTYTNIREGGVKFPSANSCVPGSESEITGGVVEGWIRKGIKQVEQISTGMERNGLLNVNVKKDSTLLGGTSKEEMCITSNNHRTSEVSNFQFSAPQNVFLPPPGTGTIPRPLLTITFQITPLLEATFLPVGMGTDLKLPWELTTWVRC